MRRAVIYTGADRYDGRWHDHAATSQRIAEILGELGIDGRVRGTRPRTAGDLSGVDLVVLNMADGVQGPEDATDDEWAPAWEMFRAYVARGGPVLVLHLSISVFGADEAWNRRLGGAWVQGTSMHPPIAGSHVRVHAGAHPIATGFADFDVYDEMYSYLDVQPGSSVLATHRYEGIDHALAWVTEADGGRIVYDALGHGVEAYDSAGRVELLKREIQWLTAAQ